MEIIGDILSSIGGVAASASTGGIFGAVMALVGSWQKAKQAKAEHAAALQMREQDRIDKAADREHELKLLAMRGQQEDQEHDNNMDFLRTQNSGAGLLATIQADSKLDEHLPPWAVACKALFRPFITTILISAHIYMIFYLWNSLLAVRSGAQDTVLGLVFKPEEIVELIRYSLYSLVFNSSTALAWWFGDRGMAPPSYKR